MSRYDTRIRARAILPQGYHYGAHVSHPGSEGYYVIRESDGAACLAQTDPTLDGDPSAAELDEAIAAAARDVAECEAIAARLEQRALDSLGEP